jgi:phosphoribosylamine--glycine ligase
VNVRSDEQEGDKLKVTGFESHFGDPETQALMPLLRDAGLNWHDTLLQTADGRLDPAALTRLTGRVAVCVTLADPAIKGNMTGTRILGLDQQRDDVVITQGRTKKWFREVHSTKGDAVSVTAIGGSFQEARGKAYDAIGPEGVKFYGAVVRKEVAAMFIPATA